MKLLVIEDDELTTQALTTILTAHNYAVEVASDGQAGLALIESFEYDLIILDVLLPKLDGVQVCQQARSRGCKVPILLLTGCHSHHDRAIGLDAGADDYVAKPFDAEELVARIRALLRRSSSNPQPLLEWGDLKLDPIVCEVTYGTALLPLTPKEYALLELFLRNTRRVFSCGNIIEHLWAYEDAPTEDAVRTHIKGLRQKLKAAGAPTDFVETVYGIGYRLKPKSAASQNANETVTSIEQELRAKLCGVWNRSQERINAQIVALEQVAASQDKIPSQRQSVQQEAKRQAHTLAGVLGTFGFIAGSHLAHEIEHVLATDHDLKPKELKRLQDLTAALRRSIDIPASTSTLLEQSCPELPQLIEHVEQQPILLVVDRDPAFTERLIDEAHRWSYQVITASTAQAVETFCTSHSLSIVLLNLDCFASREEGLDLLTRLNHRSPPIPVLVLSNCHHLPERLEVARRGGRFLLSKSMPLAQIFEAVVQVMQRTALTQTKVLVVNEDVTLLAAIKALLTPWGLQVPTLSDPHWLWETLEATVPDLLILDLEFSDLSGIELCQVVRNDLRWSNLPIVILTAQTASETVNQVFAAGADDFVSKPIVSSELVTGIINRLERTRLLRQVKETDPLTKVANRQKSTQDIEAFLQLATRCHHPVAIAVIDVDQLRTINHQYGHATGDAVLGHFGQLLRQSFRGEDVVARWGGEEFVVGMYGMTREDGVQRLLQIIAAIYQQPFTTQAGEPFQVTFSAGVAQYPDDGTELETLYRKADSALGEAKRLRAEANLSNSITSILPVTTASHFAPLQF